MARKGTVHALQTPESDAAPEDELTALRAENATLRQANANLATLVREMCARLDSLRVTALGSLR